MGLRKKFNLILFTALLIGFAVIYWFHKKSVLLTAEMDLAHQAEITFQVTESIRTYNETEVRPLINNANTGFKPQTVGSYAATQVMNNVLKTVPYLHYKVAIDESEIEIYKPNFWQQRIIDQFKNNPNLPIINDNVSDENGRFLVYAKPIANEGQITGAKIVRINEKDLYNTNESEVLVFTSLLLIVLVVVLITLNVVMNILVFKPLKLMSQKASEISQGQSKIDELDVKGGDEISKIAESFNRMQRSLKAAMGMLS